MALRLETRGTSVIVPRTLTPSRQQIAPANAPATIVLLKKKTRSSELNCRRMSSKNSLHEIRTAPIDQLIKYPVTIIVVAIKIAKQNTLRVTLKILGITRQVIGSMPWASRTSTSPLTTIVANSVEIATPLRPMTTRQANNGPSSRTITRHNSGMMTSVVIPKASIHKATWTIINIPTAAPKRSTTGTASTHVNNNCRDSTTRVGGVQEEGRIAKALDAHKIAKMDAKVWHRPKNC